MVEAKGWLLTKKSTLASSPSGSLTLTAKVTFVPATTVRLAGGLVMATLGCWLLTAASVMTTVATAGLPTPAPSAVLMMAVKLLVLPSLRLRSMIETSTVLSAASPSAQVTVSLTAV